MVMQSVKIAIKAILSNKMRTFLTMLGIIIGVVSLVVLVSLVTSATDSVTDDINSIGKDMLVVSVIDDKGIPIKQKDLNEIGENESIDRISPVVSINGTAKKDRDSISITAEGTNNAYFSIQSIELLYGRLIIQPDIDNGTYVTVISYETAEEVFGHPNVVGRTLDINGRDFDIVGVLEEDSSMSAGMRSQYLVYIPITVAERMSDSGGGISFFYISATDTRSMDEMEEYLDIYMLSRLNNDENAYNVTNQNLLSETMESVTNTFAVLLGGIAAISLLVGGIGIMNIMLVSVTERTREIGIRKAIGAKSGSIMLQFITEAMSICLIGCALGIVLSLSVLAVVNAAVEDFDFNISVPVVLVAVLFSTIIGLIFGVYPARKAAVMDPIEALRYE